MMVALPAVRIYAITRGPYMSSETCVGEDRSPYLGPLYTGACYCSGVARWQVFLQSSWQRKGHCATLCCQVHAAQLVRPSGSPRIMQEPSLKAANAFFVRTNTSHRSVHGQTASYGMVSLTSSVLEDAQVPAMSLCPKFLRLREVPMEVQRPMRRHARR